MRAGVGVTLWRRAGQAGGRRGLEDSWPSFISDTAESAFLIIKVPHKARRSAGSRLLAALGAGIGTAGAYPWLGT
jgi:hypothetical protein